MRATVLILLTSLAALTACTSKPEKFDSPEAAVQALIEAAKAEGDGPLLKLLGKDAKPLVDSGDPVADKNARAAFVANYEAANSIDKSEPDFATLEVGEDKWPFPIPLVSEGGKWHFDSPTGIDEVINRRVGANELATIQSCLAYVDAQREYYTRNAENDPFLHYASRLISTDGKKDGLYWPAGDSEEPSPLGEGFAKARAEGYAQDGSMSGEPFHGYIYRMLNKQGPNAKGGAYDYLVKDQLLGGFAVVAFPADYGNSGVMTFIVNHDGVVFSKDLGAETSKVALAMDTFDPDQSWKKEEPEQTAGL
jgi:hypothetical protein